MQPREWDGATYDRISAPMEAMGLDTLARLTLAGNETVIDAGCGSGRVTEALIAALPRGRVIAVDGSADMIVAARERLGAQADLRLGDLLDLVVEEPVDAVLSTATFHWIADHDRLFTRLRAALRPGGRLVTQCGGRGNIDKLHAAARRAAAQPPFTEHFDGWTGPWNFAGPEQTAQRLHHAGFTAIRTWLEPRLVVPGDARTWLRTVNLGAHLDRLPGGLHDAYIDAVIGETGEPVEIDYVRLNIEATAA